MILPQILIFTTTAAQTITQIRNLARQMLFLVNQTNSNDALSHIDEFQKVGTPHCCYGLKHMHISKTTLQLQTFISFIVIIRVNSYTNLHKRYINWLCHLLTDLPSVWILFIYLFMFIK